MSLTLGHACTATFAPQHCIIGNSDSNFAMLLQSLRANADKSVSLLLEEAMQTNSRVPDTHAAIASRVHNKVLMLDNPTSNLISKARGAGNHKQVSSRLLPCSKRPKIVSGQCRSVANCFKLVRPSFHVGHASCVCLLCPSLSACCINADDISMHMFCCTHGAVLMSAR